MKKILLPILYLFFSVFSMAAMASNKNIEPIDTQKLMSGERTLKVGHIDFPPFYIKDDSGLDADILRAVAKQASIAKVEFVHFNNLPDLLAALNENKIDIIANGILVTPERAKNYLLSDSYLQGGLALLYYKGKQNFQNVHDLMGHTIGMLRGSYPVTWAKENGIPEKSIKTFENMSQLTHALKQNQVDAIITNYTATLYLQKMSHEPMKVVLVKRSPLVYLLRKQDSPLQKKLNLAINELSSNKTLMHIRSKYLDSNNHE